MISLKERFDGRQLERYKYYTYLMAAVAGDIPMGRPALTPMRRVIRGHQRLRMVWAGTMNTIYIARMMDECVRTFESKKSDRVCDLDPSKTLVLLLSMPGL